jgi:hypothetical protein
MAFRLTGAAAGKPRLDADAELQPDDFRAIAEQLGQSPLRARKTGTVAVRRAQRRQTVVTKWNGEETTNVAEADDWIVTSLSPAGEPLLDRNGATNTYVIAADKFPGLYQPTEARSAHGAVYRAKGAVEAIDLPGGFDIVAPWGERQHADAGYLILNGEQVYGNNAETFAATYEAGGPS